MNLLTNPTVLRMALLLLATGLAFVMGVAVIRRMRRSISAEAEFVSAGSASVASLPVHMYNAVIQQLKQQKHELLTQQQEDKRRAKTSESISAAVLSNLSCGVVFFTPDGLVRQANAAAKQILGFASPTGMKASHLFRSAALLPSPGNPGIPLAQAVESGVRDNTAFRPRVATYVTPAGVERTLEVNLTPVLAPNGEVLGAACVINDRTEIEHIRRQQELHNEVSAEMALDLRTSLNTISEYAQKLAGGDAHNTRDLALDIAVEASQLEHRVGGFLAGARVSGKTELRS